jgi:hypothetical protein
VRHFDLHAAVANLRVIEDLSQVVHRAAGHSRSLQSREPVRGRSGAGQALDQWDQFAAVLHSGGISGEA